MAYDQANTYETIELFGLTEKDAQLPIPQDDILNDSIVRETFETLLGQLRNTGLEAEIEPLAHGLATILQRRKVALGSEVDRTADKIGALAKCHDGSEIAETALEEAQARFLQLRDIVGAIETMSEAAAEASPSRVSSRPLRSVAPSITWATERALPSSVKVWRMRPTASPPSTGTDSTMAQCVRASMLCRRTSSAP